MVKKMKRLERQDSRPASKKCPDCDQQCAIALRSCNNCHYAFTKARPVRSQTKPRSAALAAAAKVSKGRGTPTPSTSATGEAETNLDKEGRRFRTKRMRPDYFNSLELEYASRTFRQRKPKPEKEKKKKRGRPKGSTGIPRKPKEEKKREEEEPKLPELDDLYANFSKEKMQQFSFILDEINLKMTSTMFRPL